MSVKPGAFDVATPFGVLSASEGNLQRAWRRALRAGVQRGRTIAGAHPLREEDIVLGIVLSAVSILDSELQLLLSGTSVRGAVSGVFCHGQPTVVAFEDPMDKGRGRLACELGDLLVVVRYQARWGSLGKALLLQTKVDDPHPHTGDDQWVLYNRWPPFQWTHQPHFQRQPRPPAGHAGAQYAVISSDARRQPLALFAEASAVPRRLEDELTDLMLLRSGRFFKDRPWARAESGRGWSEIVWDILDDTALRSTQRRGHSYPRSSRAMIVCPASGSGAAPSGGAPATSGETSQLALVAGELVEIWRDPHGDVFVAGADQPPFMLEAEGNDGDGGGVSVVLIDFVEDDGNS
jgi:hypothetical protein